MDQADTVPDIARQPSATARGARHLFLVDGSGYIFRAFHALPPMTRSDGTPVNAVFGFTNMLIKLLEDTKADRLAVIFDASEHTFRNELYPEYKAHRPEAPPELVPQFALIREAVRAFNVPCIELAGFEADDLIASYAKAAVAAGDDVTVVSSDKDLMQLVNDRVLMLDPIKNRRIGADEVKERFGVGPDKVIYVQALCGDPTDNVPGVRGIGVKTAAELINQFGDLDGLYAHVQEIKQPKRRETLQENEKNARISLELVTLKDDVELPLPIDALVKHAPEVETLRAFFQAQEFRKLIERLDGGLIVRGAEAGTAAPAPAADVVEAAPVRYALVQDVAALDGWIARAREQGQLGIAAVTGGTRLEPTLVGLALALGDGDACYVPLGHVAPGGSAAAGLDLAAGPPPKQLKAAAALDRLAPLLADPGVLKIGHDVKRALRALPDVPVTPFDDVMLLSYALEGGLHGHDLDELAQLHLGHAMVEPKTLVGSGKSQIDVAAVPLDAALGYAAELADVALRLHKRLKPQLVGARVTALYETIERPLVPIIAAMERRGIKVDRAALKRLSGEFAQRISGLETEIFKLAGRSFNIGSPKQLGVVLFEEQKLPSGRRSKNGDWSTHSDILEPLAEQYDLPARVLDWRQTSKLKSTYADALVEEIDRAGRVHTTYALAVASTGRLSSNDPNLQNIPVRTEEGRLIRSAFVAEKGCKLLSVDYSQIELRLLAEIADIALLKEAFRAGVDIHALTASQVFNVPLADLDKETRRKAKAINFGIIYGISAFGLSKYLGCSSGEASDYIRAYFEKYPGVRVYMDECKAFARRHGFVRTLFGRKCHVPGINEKNPAKRGFAERQSINAPLQGSAADIIKRAMIHVPDALAAAKLDAAMLLQVHDELLFEVPDAQVEETAQVVRRVMEGAVALSVPLVAEAGFGVTWAEAH
ncbi:MAG TPA: DNA polymerase I [Candidatus Sulfotelmatobacter sp.]|nr:DNA polymerase I [Candidatus Sulfotelmatobacter sp.]